MNKTGDIKSIIAIAICIPCFIAIIIGYAQAVRIGILHTIYTIPFFVIAIILSTLSMKSQVSKRLSIIGLSMSIGGLTVSWLFAGFILMTGLFSGLNSSTTSDMRFLSFLNWE